MNSKLKDENFDNLIKAILSISDKDEAYDFFEDLCTINELKAMSQRFAVARQLRNKTVYTEIVENTGASTATISRVNRALLYGTGGYEKIISRMEKNK